MVFRCRVLVIIGVLTVWSCHAFLFAVKHDPGQLGWDDFPDPVKEKVASYACFHRLQMMDFVCKSMNAQARKFLHFIFSSNDHASEWVQHFKTRNNALALPSGIRFELFDAQFLEIPQLKFTSIAVGWLQNGSMTGFQTFVNQSQDVLSFFQGFSCELDFRGFQKLQSVSSCQNNFWPPNMRSLTVDYDRYDPLFMKNLGALAHLENLELHTSFSVDALGLLPLFKSKSLKYLTLTGVDLCLKDENQDVINAIQTNTTLIKLFIFFTHYQQVNPNPPQMHLPQDSNINALFFEAIAQVPSLKILKLKALPQQSPFSGYHFSARDVDLFGNKLTVLDLSTQMVSKQVLRQLFQSQTLENLTVRFNFPPSWPTLQALSQNKTLKKLGVYCSVPADNLFFVLAKHPTLECLKIISSATLSQDELKALGNHSRLHRLVINHFSVPREYEFHLNPLKERGALHFVRDPFQTGL